MTEIRLHGKLGRDYGDVFYYEISKPEHAMQAIDANNEGFLDNLMKMHKQNINYCLIIDKKHINKDNIANIDKPPKTIDVVPVIHGGGWGAVASFLVKVLIAVAITYALFLLIDPVQPESAEIEASTRGVDESFLFSNKANLAQQGTSVPLGYGRLRVGSSVINFTNKNFPQTTKTIELMTQNIQPDGVLQAIDKSESTYY